MHQTAPAPPPNNEQLNSLCQLSDRCVMCGMCLQTCPTYLHTGHEAESPRGRISLIQGLCSGQLPVSEKFSHHLDNCLTCRACELICPSGVEYGKLIDGARSYINQTQPEYRSTSTTTKLLKKGITHPTLLRTAGKLARFARASGIQRLWHHSRLQQLLPIQSRHDIARSYYPAVGQVHGRVGLFTGCMGTLLDGETLHASIRLLTQLGFDVDVPRQQTCCGALHAHSGDAEQALAFARQNLQAFSQHDSDAIIHVASGCGAYLSEYNDLSGLENAEHTSARAFSARSRDINQFLCDIDWPDHLVLQPLAKRLALHTPCSLRNVLRQGDKPLRLLCKIPELEIVELPDKHRCCGAAGSYMLDHPAMAEALRQDKIDSLETLAPAILASSNIGCALHLGAGIRAAGLEIEVMHPVVLLSRQLTI